jgi:hypothetical protein
MPDASSQRRADIDTSRVVGIAAHLNTTAISTWREHRESLPTQTDLPQRAQSQATATVDRRPPHDLNNKPCRCLPARDMLGTDGGSPYHVRRSGSASLIGGG